MYKEPESNGTGLNDSDLFMQDFKQYRQLKSLSTNNDIISFRDETYLQKNLETAIIKVRYFIQQPSIIFSFYISSLNS